MGSKGRGVLRGDARPVAPRRHGTSHVRIYPCGSGSFRQVYASEHAGTATATVASWSTWFKDPDGNTITIDNGGAPS